jgi:hypothetical protein
MARRPRILPTTVADRAVNRGAVEVAADGSVPVTLFKWQVDDADAAAMTLYVQCDELVIPPAAIGTADFRPMVHVEWGNGGATNRTDLEVTYRQRQPFVCASFIATAFIASFPLAQSDGTFATAPVPVGASAKFYAFIAQDPDAVPLFATRWITQMATDRGLLIEGQTRLATFRAFSDAASAAGGGFFLLFDSAVAPAPGDTPIDAFPAEAQPAVGATPSGAIGLFLGQTRAFVHGVAWAFSSTPFTFTAIAGAKAFVVGEIET